VALIKLNDKISRLKISGGVTSDLGSVVMTADDNRYSTGWDFRGGLS